MTKATNKPIKFNLGCGIKLMPGFINVDNFMTEKELKKGAKTKKGFFKNAEFPKTAQFVKADIRQLPFEDNVADYVLLSHVIEHISFLGVPQVLKEIYRVLKPGGKFVLMTNDFNGLALGWIDYISQGKFDLKTYETKMQEFYGIQLTGGEFHISAFNADFLNYSLVKAGFQKGEIVLVKQFQPFPKIDGIEYNNKAVARNDQLIAYATK